METSHESVALWDDLSFLFFAEEVGHSSEETLTGILEFVFLSWKQETQRLDKVEKHLSKHYSFFLMSYLDDFNLVYFAHYKFQKKTLNLFVGLETVF